MTRDAVIGIDGRRQGAVRRLQVMLTFVVRDDRRLQLLVVRSVKRRSERRDAQGDHEHARSRANHGRCEAEERTHLTQEYRRGAESSRIDGDRRGQPRITSSSFPFWCNLPGSLLS
jgi:hypothetical protein